MRVQAGATPVGLFDNYTRLASRLPDSAWMALRALVLLLAIAETVLLFVQPELGLRLFWAVTVPCLPALFAIAPGLWRQVCPMAFLNQLPRTLGRGGTRALSAGLRSWSYLIAVGLLVAFVSARAPLLNGTGWATGTLCAGALVLALAGGLSFKGRSGWCGTFCPLAPVQRSHGQAPIVVVRNGYCPTCVGCQKNCLDFNPRAAIFGDLDDDDPRHAAQRLLFMSMLPGLIVGYYTLAPLLERGLGAYLLGLAASMLVWTGLFFMLQALVKTSSYRMATVFGVAALLLYYVFAGPVLVHGVEALAGVTAPDALVLASRFVGVPVVAGVWRASLQGERAYRALQGAQGGVRIDDSRLKRGAAATTSVIHIVERRSGKRFVAAPGKTLLETMEAAGVPIDFGCRSGLCGADPVGIVDGHGCLSEPNADEQATLRRLGLTGRARLACSARMSGDCKGDLTIDCDPHSVPVVASAAPPQPKRDLALAEGIQRVVIVGNGVAGVTVAETLRGDSDSLEISLVAEEAHHFYNRMALGRIVYNRSSMDGMFLLPDSWYREQRIGVWLNTMATAIDREARTLRLGTGERLPYDRLVLATGARAVQPGPGYAGPANAFTLRSAGDAQSIRATVQRLAARTAIVIGGGVLGVEAAEALRYLGLRVTLLHRGRWLMDRRLDAEGGQRLAGYLENCGIATITDARIARFESDELLRAVVLEDGRRIATDVCVACAGIQPNTALAQAAGLKLGRGIKTNACMQTSDPMILAVGDVAQSPLPGPAGLWQVAVEQGRVAAATIFGQRLQAALPRIVLQLKSDGIDLRSYGEPDAVVDGAEVLTAEPTATAWWRLVARGGDVLAAVYVGPPGTAQALTQVLKVGGTLSACLSTLPGTPGDGANARGWLTGFPALVRW